MLNFLSVLEFLGFSHENTALFIGMAIGFLLTFYKFDKKMDKTNHKMDLVDKEIKTLLNRG